MKHPTATFGSMPLQPILKRRPMVDADDDGPTNDDLVEATAATRTRRKCKIDMRLFSCRQS